ncbi:MAG: hypothetical protein LBI82_02430 [Dysgonamonadaceae bacterium]|jgi:hypothetical protein|nr:hypothetical protein [Dysgonamonadaceae bacterium]
METNKVLNQVSLLDTKKEVYEAPVIEAVVVEVERGFQMSVARSYDPLVWLLRTSDMR